MLKFEHRSVNACCSCYVLSCRESKEDMEHWKLLYEATLVEQLPYTPPMHCLQRSHTNHLRQMQRHFWTASAVLGSVDNPTRGPPKKETNKSPISPPSLKLPRLPVPRPCKPKQLNKSPLHKPLPLSQACMPSSMSYPRERERAVERERRRERERERKRRENEP